jgi:hypothetical protein
MVSSSVLFFHSFAFVLQNQLDLIFDYLANHANILDSYLLSQLPPLGMKEKRQTECEEKSNMGQQWNTREQKEKEKCGVVQASKCSSICATA